MSSSNVVPVVLWGNSPPSHTISCIITTYDQKTIITGSTDGQLGVWDLRFGEECEIKVVPRNLIFAHSAKVTALAKASDGWDNDFSIVSAAENGELCLWDTDDGLCIQSNIIDGVHLALHSFHVSIGTSKEWRLVCHGSYSDIYVLDAMSLEIIYTLRSPSFTNWISAACVVRPARRAEDVVVGLSLSGMLSIWTVSSSTEPPNSKFLKPAFEQDLSKQMLNTRASTLNCNPFTQRCILVVTAKLWMLYDSSDFKFLASVPSPPSHPWLGGDFVAADCVLVWSTDGQSYLYKLPPACCPGFQDCTQDNSFKEPTVLQMFNSLEQKVSAFDHNPAMYFSYGRRGPFYKLLLKGGTNGSVTIWKIDDHVLVKPLGITTQGAASPVASMTIDRCWDSPYRPCGILDSLEAHGQSTAVTSTLYLADQGRIVCGRQDGSIVIISATRAAIAQLLKTDNTDSPRWPPHRLLIGHRGRVTCLLYPNDDSSRYGQEFLVSGGADFTVKLWNIFTGDLLHTFTPHGGEVSKLICTPSNCSNRIQSCVCSVAQDHSVALLGVRERKCLLLAATHTFPVERIRWRALDDFLIVGCTDGSVYVWQMETGHLDRCVSGQVALDILSACDDDSRSSESARLSKARGRNLSRKLNQLASNLPPGASAAVKKLKQRTGQSSSSPPSDPCSSPKLTEEQVEASNTAPLKIVATRANRKDPEIHVLLFDTEALICHLVTEENPRLAARAPVPSRTKQESGGKTSFSKKVKKKIHLPGRHSNTKQTSFQQAPAAAPKEPSFTYETHDVAQLMISCLHTWDLDPNTDEVCLERLGLLKPVKPVSFGLLTREGRISMVLPGWYDEVSVQRSRMEVVNLLDDSPINAGDSRADKGEDTNGTSDGLSRLCYRSHWLLSSALSTLHLVGLVSVANTLMSMNQVSFVIEEKRLALLTSSSLDVKSSSSYSDEEDETTEGREGDVQLALNHRAHIKAGWSQLAALHCCLLADLLKSPSYKPPLLHILARRWQDRCLEVREAAQAILLAELRRIGPENRKQVVETWAPQLPKKITLPGLGAEPQPSESPKSPPSPMLDRAESQEDEVLFPPEEVSSVLTNVKKLLQYDTRRRQATAIVLMGVIGAEFQKEIEMYAGRSSTENKRQAAGGETIMDSNTVRQTGKALMYLLLKPRTSRMSAHTSVKRAAIDLIGRGFTLWEPYMDVSAVLLSLLELCVDNKGKNLTYSKGLPLSPAADTNRSAHHALSLIATARPSVFIATIAKEVARSVAAQSSISFNQPSPAAIAVYSHVRHQPSQNAEVQSSSVLNRAKYEILHIIGLMIEKTQQEVVDLLPDVVDVVVYCLDQKLIKEKGLQEVFPGLCRFNMVSYSHQSRRLAVGSRSGQIAIHDLRASRLQMVSAHQSPVTALSFSPDDRVLASYSFGDSRICFWQTGSTLFGMLGSSTKCTRSYNTVSSSPKMSQSLLKLVRLVWINQKTVILLMADGTEYKYTI